MKRGVAIVMLSGLISVFTLSLVFAASPDECPGPGPCPPADPVSVSLTNPLGSTSDMRQVVQNILDALILIGAPIAAVMVIIGGFQMLFSAGDPERFKNGRQTILYTAIGYGIIVLANGVGDLIQNILS